MIHAFRGQHRFLSNFYLARVRLDGVQYPTVEHAYQAAKTTDEEERKKIRTAGSPGEAKKMGRRVTIRPDWTEIRIQVMTDLVRQKFAQEPYRSLLLRTGHCELIEGNRWNDTFWGVCNGVGENHLGKILMQIRGELRQ